MIIAINVRGNTKLAEGKLREWFLEWRSRITCNQALDVHNLEHVEDECSAGLKDRGR
jgi:hypothetical protein